MTPEEGNKIIAEFCGWKRRPDLDWYDVHMDPDTHHKAWVCDGLIKEETQLNYYNDLNAMHSAENRLPRINWYDFTRNLRAIILRDCDAGLLEDFWFYHATAPQRWEAFLRAINKWKD